MPCLQIVRGMSEGKDFEATDTVFSLVSALIGRATGFVQSSPKT